MKEYIEREPLIEQFDGGDEIKSMSESIHDSRFVEALKRAPVADVEPVRHGKWIEHDYEHYIKPDDTAGIRPIQYRCSLCGRVETLKEPYCHCGAKMDKGE